MPSEEAEKYILRWPRAQVRVVRAGCNKISHLESLKEPSMHIQSLIFIHFIITHAFSVLLPFCICTFNLNELLNWKSLLPSFLKQNHIQRGLNKSVLNQIESVKKATKKLFTIKFEEMSPPFLQMDQHKNKNKYMCFFGHKSIFYKTSSQIELSVAAKIYIKKKLLAKENFCS